MTWPFDIETASAGHVLNTWGLAWSPDGSKMIWAPDSSSLGEYEAWDSDTRTVIASGSFDFSYATFVGSAAGFGLGLTDDGTVYGTATVSGGVPATTHLTKWSGHGAGTQTNVGGTPQMAGVRVLKAGDGKTYVGCVSFSFFLDGYIFCHDTPGTPPVHLDTLATTGVACQIKDYVLDDTGKIWAVLGATAGHGDLAADQIGFWCVVGGANEFITATLPAAVAGSVFEAYVGFAGGHFIVNTQQGDLITVELDGTVSHTVTGPIGDGSFNIPVQMHLIAPGAASFWIENTEYSTADCSTLRTLPFSLWGTSIDGHVIVAEGCFYVSRIRAFFVDLNAPDAAKTIAWLFFPRRTVRADIRIGHGSTADAPPPVPVPGSTPAGVIAAGLEAVWDYKRTAGLKLVPDKTLPADAASLPAGASLGTFGPASSNYVIFTLDADVSRWDFSGYDVIADGCTVDATNCRLKFVGGGRLAEPTNGGTLNLVSCDVDMTGLLSFYHGGTIVPAGCTMTWTDVHAWGAPRTYCDNFGDLTWTRCYVEAFGIDTDPLDHGETAKTDSGAHTVSYCVVDASDGGEILTGITGLFFGKSDVVSTSVALAYDHSILNFSQPLPWTLQAGITVGDGLSVTMGHCAVKQGSSGFLAKDVDVAVTDTGSNFELVSGDAFVLS